MKKKHFFQQIVMGLLIVFAVAFLVGTLWAAEYPEKPITLIVPFKAGGGTDTSMRTLQPALEKNLGVKLNFVYKTGAGGALGYLALGSSKADGYTLGAVNWPHVLLPTIIKEDPGYKLEDIQPVAVYNRDRPVLAVHPDSPWKTFNDLLEDSIKRPRKISMAAPVPNGYLLGAIYKMEEVTGIQLKTVWFDGGAQSAHAFLGKHTDAWLINGSVMRKYKDQVRPLAVLDTERAWYFPESPTFFELGYEGVTNYTYRAIVAPAGTDPDQIKILSRAIGEAVKDPNFQKTMKGKGVDPYFMDTPEFEEFSRKELESIKMLVEKYKIIE